MDKSKQSGTAEKVVRRTTHWTYPQIDWCHVRSCLFTLTALILLLAIGAWVGWKLGGGRGVDVFINSGEEKLSEEDHVQGVVAKKWTQVRIEQTSGHLAKPPPEESEQSAVLEFNATNAPAIFGGDARAISFLFVSKGSNKFEKVLDEYRSAAHELKGDNVTFAYVDIDREDVSRLMDFFAVKGEGDVPAIRLHSIEGGKMLKFRPEPSKETKELRSSHIIDFVRSHLANELKPYYRSEPTPTDWDKEAVKVLTGDNFDQVVLRGGGDKHVFVEFYASWCGFCKKLTPIWEELAEKYKDHGNVIIAKIDGMANEVPDLEVHAFPAIKLFPASGVDGVTDYQRQGIDYNGPRTVEGLSKFLDSFIHKA